MASVVWGLIRPGRYTLLERVHLLPVYVLSRVLWRVRIEWSHWYTDRDRSDLLLSDRMQGGAVLVANHCSSMDPFFVQLCAGRRVHWMVAAEYFGVPLVGGLLRAFEAIPTRRGGIDTASTRNAMAIARSGRFVGMFPEGRINRTEDPLLTIRPGAAMVALRARVPLVPIWIEGAPIGPSIFSALFRAARIRVLVGAPDEWGLHQQVLSEQSDRDVSEQWIGRVMGNAMSQSGRTGHAVTMAGKRWLQEN
jgi:1-acyl-sn-glycerol-3-phosphate acyltransferase